MDGAEAAREYHRLTVHHPTGPSGDDPRLVRGFRRMQWERRPPQFKTYPGLGAVPLPEELASPSPGALDAAALAWLLFLSGGVVRVVDVGGEPLWFRAAGSAGNLSPVELYLVTGHLPGLDAGVYHYEPVGHALTRLAGAPSAARPSLVLTGVPWRTGWKYAERGWRHLYWDAGTMLAHTLALAEHAGWPARLELGFVDAAVSALVGADGTHELPLAVVRLADDREPLPPATGAPAGHLADRPLEFPLVTATQRAGDLADDQAVARWRQKAASFAPAAATETPAPGLARPLEDVIRRRGSTRRFDPDVVAPAELLAGALAWATRAVPGDFVATGGTLLEHQLAVHAVEGYEAGAYRWRDGALERLWAGALRPVARHLCLGQALGGDGAYTAFHCAPLDPLLQALGARGYRAGLLEAGVVEGRLHLAAFALGFGATGLTFFDDEVSRFFRTTSAPMLVTAVGAPAYRSRTGGLPRRPVRLGR